MNDKVVFGIDVSKHKLDCALLVEGKYKTKVLANDAKGLAELHSWLAKRQALVAHVCMEATGVYWEACAEFLCAQGLKVSVVNPAQTKAFGGSRLTRTKTDATDAKLIAEFCQRMAPALWQPPLPNEQALRALVQRLEALQTIHTQKSNRLEVARDAVRTGRRSHPLAR